MAIKCVVVPESNQVVPEASKKCCDRAKVRGELTSGKLSGEIAEGNTSVSVTEVPAALNELTKIQRCHLDYGFDLFHSWMT